jgi:hypothetical protein
MPGKRFADYCVYSIRHTHTLESWHMRGGRGEFRIGQVWRTGKELLEKATDSKRAVAIIFAPAEDTTFIVGRGELQRLRIRANYTTVIIRDFALFEQKHRKTALRKRDGGKLDSNFVRPYAICRTPLHLGDWPVWPNPYVRTGEDRMFSEGEKLRVYVNRYERDPTARAECIRRNGFQCSGCGINFSERYGKSAANFIQVHHVTPIRQGRRRTNPSRDLIPICPNCHAVVHLRTPAFKIEDIRRMLLRNNR